MRESGTRPSYSPGLTQVIKKAHGEDQAGLTEEAISQILQSIGYEGTIYLRFITHEDAKAYRHNLHGTNLCTGDRKALEVDWAANDSVVHNNSKYADPHPLNLPRSFEQVWECPFGAILQHEQSRECKGNSRSPASPRSIEEQRLIDPAGDPDPARENRFPRSRMTAPAQVKWRIEMQSLGQKLRTGTKRPLRSEEQKKAN